MRRNAIQYAASGLVLACCGCSLFAKKDAALADDPAYGALSDYSPVSSTPSYAAATPTDPYSTYPSTPSYAADTTATLDGGSPALTASGTRYHTVGKGDTLYALARRYYGEHRRWKDIYEANRSQITDPNRIRVGQRLLIP